MSMLINITKLSSASTISCLKHIIYLFIETIFAFPSEHVIIAKYHDYLHLNNNVRVNIRCGLQVLYL